MAAVGVGRTTLETRMARKRSTAEAEEKDTGWESVYSDNNTGPSWTRRECTDDSWRRGKRKERYSTTSLA
jgi:hypothetical protein